MPLSAHLLLAGTALCCFATVFAITMEGFTLGQQCSCLKNTDDIINYKLFKKMEVLPAGSQCPKVEIILTLRDNKKVCINPEAHWVQRLLFRLTQSRNGKKK